MRVAVVDIGSNTFRLLITLVRPDGGLRTQHIERRMLHLGGVVGEHGLIPTEEIERSVDTIRSMSDFMERFGVDRVLAVATAALREASNGPEVADRLGEVLGTPVRIITGEQEAALSYLGVSAAIEFPPGPRAVLDLGGGSLEVARGDAERALECASWPIGVSRLQALLGRPTVITPTEVNRLHAIVDEQLAGSPPMTPGTTAVLIGGTVRALARHVADRTRDWVPRSLNQMTIGREELAESTALLLPLTPEQRVDEQSVDPERASTLPIAGLIITRAMEHLGIESALISDWGLRTGVVMDAVGITTPPPAEVRGRSLVALRDEFLGDDPHPEHVALLLGQLLEQTTTLHGLDDHECALLEATAHVHDVGRAIGHSGQHRHSAYLVEHADLRGISPDDLAIILSIVRSHKGGPPKVSYPPFRAMQPQQRSRVRRMAAVFQLADALDRPRDGSVKRITAADNGETLLIRTHGIDVTPDWEAMRSRVEYASVALGRRIEFVS